MEIRSYRAVFDLERRIYRIDRLRLNPTGVPVRGVLYGLALILAALLCASLPPLSYLVHALPWYVTELGLPVGAAAMLTVVRIDGRPAHLAAQALLRHRLHSRHSIGLRSVRAGRGAEPGVRWYPSATLLLPDGSDAHMRRLRYSGPGAVLVAVAHECAETPAPLPGVGPRLSVRELPGRRAPVSGRVIALAPGARLSVE
jgi:hypothetical protein